MLLIGTRVDAKDVECSVSAPHMDSVKAVDAPFSAIPYGKQDLVHIMNRVPIGFHSVEG